MHILEKIVAYKKQEVAQAKSISSIVDLTKSGLYNRSCNSLLSKLQANQAPAIIAEFKRKSPSKQNINLSADLSQVTEGYADAGAAAISMLTDRHFFGGNSNFLTDTRIRLSATPLLRKDFIVDEYQIHEAKAIGADIILLITEILTKKQVIHFSQLARDLGMESLLELHSEIQLDKYTDTVSYVGVNNRDLTTFEVDYDRSKSLYDRLPDDVPKIAESGLNDPNIVAMLYDYGFTGFLMGEHFMRHEDPGQCCRSFIQETNKLLGTKHMIN